MTRALRPGDLRCPATGKQAYVDKETALQHMNVVYRKEARGRTPARVYRCQSCGWWHMTST
jgi:predicted RNA-binding Zn-ribbon protein involved in translation (DUF1610 family)